MKVTIQKDNEPEQQAELFAIGTCLGLEIGKSVIRVALTPSQWKLLSKSAADRGR